MKIWLTTTELAEAALPGLPASRQGWDIYAQRHQWQAQAGKSRVRAGRGGGVEYHVDLLPPAALASLAARKIGAVALTSADAQLAAAEPASLQLTAEALEGRDARLALLAAADRFAADGAMTISVADTIFCASYNLGKVDVEAWVRRARPEIAPRSLRRWRLARKEGDVSRLGVDRGVARRGKGGLETAGDGAVRTYMLALIARQPHLSADHVSRLVADKFPGVTLSVRGFQRVLKGLKTENAVVLTKITNPDKFKSHHRTTGHNSHACDRLNQLWMIDASPADVMLTGGRHSVYACIDVFSRRLIIYVSKTPRAAAVLLLMRAAILMWGIPEKVKTDNGSDFVAVATKRLFRLLNIETETSTPFSPEQKGHVERSIKTFQHDLCPLLPGFIGHNVADRSVIEERKALSQRIGATEDQVFSVDLDERDMQRYCFEWSQGRYENRRHSALGMTPREKAAPYLHTVRRVEDRHALDMLLVPVAGLRTVTKSGIRIDHSYYLCPTVMPGVEVMARIDPQDMGHAWLFTQDGATFLGDAICPELAGVDPAEAVMRARAEQNRILKEGSAEILREMRKIKPRDMVDAVLRQSGQVVELSDFQRTGETVSTPALDAAREAISGRQPLLLDVDRSTAEVVKAPAPAPVTVLPETRDQRFRRALALEAEIAAGVSVSNADAVWLGAYQQGAEYGAMRHVYEDFGEAGLR